ncbi:type II toxin-antitoxin system RelE/ParE family toxin [Pseudoalteromonas sp. MMG022]|uniref:type II toxin-antitoxin system RelE/ParE family toxin n=1 Tax=Pseudoalteromonas sp. MMG022 TaxID=2909978 RepID=UPI001F404DF6|nr:type II toxin-antitoxin system RelE/ParE family toxin [Pseudoalteromonas sp. MMG022]MCF6437276.1 type II toxin-antitoxin system RelE/ParE family toxin [Pseudoalteromonas sp. MMG022]
MNNVNIQITAHAQNQIKDAIKWREHTEGVEIARDKIKSTIADFITQLETFPECGKACLYYDAPEFRELIKGDYRFVYEIHQTGNRFDIYILIFCHVKMDYQTLINQFSQF